MENIHNVVGTLVILAYLLLTILNVVQITGRPMTLIRPVSLIGGVLLLVQIGLGIGLLVSDRQVPAIHYIIAVLAALLVGLEHGWVRSRATAGQRAMAGAIIAGATTVLLVIAYMIGQSN